MGTEDAWKELIKNGGVAMKLKVDKTKAVMEERMSGGKSKTVVYPFDEAVHYTNEEFGLDETRMLTRVAPGRYKMVTKTKTGKTGDFEMKLGEQLEIEMPGFGKMTGVFMEHGDCFSSCMKIGEKTINVKGKVTGDFIVEELDVDGSLASRMKQILVRQ